MNLGSKEKPRAWSKYAKGTTAYNKLHPEEAPAPAPTPERKEKKNKKAENDAIRDPKVKELLEKVEILLVLGMLFN